jgi:hypothetical protein
MIDRNEAVRIGLVALEENGWCDLHGEFTIESIVDALIAAGWGDLNAEQAEQPTGMGDCPAAPGAICCGHPDLCNANLNAERERLAQKVAKQRTAVIAGEVYLVANDTLAVIRETPKDES